MRTTVTEVNLVGGDSATTVDGEDGLSLRSPRRRQDRGGLEALVTGVGLAVVAVVAVRARWAGLTDLGLFRDDAWLALASRVGFANAVHMGATAPGFTLLERAWIGIGPRSTRWAQVLPFLAGMASPVAIFLLVRFWRLSRWISLLAALAMALSPEDVQYSSHIKPYTTDVLLACLLVWRGEAARRSPTLRSLIILAAVCGGAFVMSGSLTPIIVGVWAALVFTHFRSRDARRRVTVVALPMVGFLGGVYLLVFRELSHALYRFWATNGDFLNSGSPDILWHKLGRAFTTITVGLFAPSGRVDAYGGAITHPRGVFWPAVLFVVLVILGITARGPALVPSLCVLAALAASGIGEIPFGTGRTDLVLYPVFLLLAALGLSQVAVFARQAARNSAHQRHIASMGIAVVIGLAVAAYPFSSTVRHPPRYPGINIAALARYVSQHRNPGDHILVDPRTRYNWALYEAKVVRLKFGGSWAAGYTVTSDNPNVFLAPSQSYEDGYDPASWVHRMSSADRLWYVGTWFGSLQNDPLYQGLLQVGYRPRGEFDSTGGFAILFVKTGT
jgi:hypothetical protein